MRRCLNDRELVMFHAGDGSEADREHLESCLGCARKYRALQSDMESLLAGFRRPPTAHAAANAGAGLAMWPRGVRWALAASVVVAAFAGGRITGLTTPEAQMAKASANGLGNQIAMADAGPSTPASYGLYIDDLMDSDASDQDQQTVDQGDTGSQTDGDSGAF
jgi:hypothetical protein